jgi:hypothetical protein
VPPVSWRTSAVTACLALSVVGTAGCGGGSASSGESAQASRSTPGGDTTQTNGSTQGGGATKTDGAGQGTGTTPSGKPAKPAAPLSNHKRLTEAKIVCAGLRLRVPEASARRTGKPLAQQASQNDLLDKATLTALERVDPPPVSVDMWHRLLSAAHQIESEQSELVKKVQAGDLAAVPKLERAKRAQRAKLAKIAAAAHLPSCRGFI